MTDLMEALFEYINKVTLQNYLAVDSDYRISSTRRDTWSLEILDHLDEEGRTLFDRYEKAAFQENSCLLEAMFLATVDLCRELNVPYYREEVPIYEIVFEHRKEKNPCSLCAKFRRGALSTTMNRLGISKIALGHHQDDAVETMVMSLFLEGRISCFQPVTYLDRAGVTQIRPMLYVQEREVRGAVRRLGLPVVENPCPANGSTRREEMKVLLRQLEERYPNLRKKIFGAIQRYPLYGWSLEENQR